MEFEIVKLYQGAGAEERLVLRALTDADIGMYMILDATFQENGLVTNTFRHPYWFEDKAIKKGEFVVLYTKEGDYSKHGNTHFFYYGSKHNVWNDNADAVTLIRISEWQVTRFKDIHVKG
jgi:hypothetical protein